MLFAAAANFIPVLLFVLEAYGKIKLFFLEE